MSTTLFAEQVHHPVLSLLQLREILHRFSSAHVREHLVYVLENVTKGNGPQSMPETHTRDVRAQLYSRIGVTTAVNSSASHSQCHRANCFYSHAEISLVQNLYMLNFPVNSLTYILFVMYFTLFFLNFTLYVIQLLVTNKVIYIYI